MKIMIHEEEEHQELFHAIVEYKSREDSEEDNVVGAENEEFYFCVHDGGHESAFIRQQIQLTIQMEANFYLLERKVRE